MDSSVGSQWAGTPACTLDTYRGSQKPRRGTLHLPAGCVTISKRWIWQIILAIVSLVARTAAYNEGRLAASYQTLPSTRPSSPVPLSFHNSTKKWNMTNEDLSNGSTKGHPPWHATGKYLYSGNAVHSSTDLPKQAGFLSYHYRQNQTSYLTPTRPEILEAHPQGSTSPIGTTPGIADAGRKGSGALVHGSLASMLHNSINILSGSLRTQSPDSSSRKTQSKQVTTFTSQELDITEPLGHVLPTSATPVTLFHFSTGSSGSHSAEISPHLTVPAPRDFTSSTTNRRFPANHQADLDTGWFQSAPAPTTVETRDTSALSASAVGSQLDAKRYTYTEVLLSSVSHYDGSKLSVPTGHGLSSAVAWVSSSRQPSTAESITQWSQRSNTTYDYPLINANVPVISYNPKPEYSSDVANSSINDLAIEIPTRISHSSEARMPTFRPSLATTHLDPDTVAVGLPTEANLSLRQQSSQSKDDLRSQGLTTQPPHLGATGAYEVSSIATEDTLSTSLAERTKLELKNITSHIELQVDPTHGAISKGVSGTISLGTDFIYWQPSTAAMLGMVLSGSTGTEYIVPLLPSASLEAVTNTPSSWELAKTGQNATTAVTPPVFSLELPLPTMEAAPKLGLTSKFISVQPKAEPAGQRYTFPQRWSEATPSPNLTSFATSRVVWTSEEPSGLAAPVVSLPAKKGSSGVTHMLSEGTSAPLPSHPNLDTVEVMLPLGSTSSEIAYVSGGPTASLAMEIFSITSPEWKDDKAWNEKEVPEVTVLSRPSSAEVWQPFSKVVTSPTTSASTLSKVAPPLLPTKDLDIDQNTSLVTTTLGTELRNKVVNASAAIAPLNDGTTTLHTPHPGYTDSSSSKPPIYLSVSETTSAQNFPVSSASAALLTTPRFLPDESKSTCSDISCLKRTIPSSFTPSPAQLFSASQPLLTRKVLVSILGPGGDGKNRSIVGVGASSARPKEISAWTVAGAETVTVIPGGHPSEQPVSKSKGPVLNESTTKENPITLSSPPFPSPAGHTLPLWFRLTGIDYTESLENKSSESYKKLEKEVKLTVNKMLSTYGSFLQTNILGFLNGSVVVYSEAVFQIGIPVPTPSDVIRTIVTEVERRAMDTFFDWRLDTESLFSDGFTLGNLEPEKLAISFTVLELASRGDLGGMMKWDHLESLRSKVTLLIGTHYDVQNISLVESGNIQGGVDIDGEVYIDTDTHVDIGWALEELMALSNLSVDLTSLSINGSRLRLQVFPVSFLVTNRIFDEKMMDRSSAERQNLVRDLSDVLMHVLSKYKSLLQVAIRKITGGSLVCHGDVIFQHPAPTSKDVLQTLARAVGPRDYLDSSTLQVDPFSFTVAGDGLQPPLANLGIPSYAVAIIALFVLALIAFPILVLLPKMLGRKDKLIINPSRDLEAGTEMFQLDNPAFRPTAEEVHSDCLNANLMMTNTWTFRQQQSVRSTRDFSDGGMTSHSI